MDEKQEHADAKEEEKILYDILISEEWPERVTLLDDDQHHSLLRVLTTAAKGFSRISKAISNPLKSLKTAPPPPSTLSSIINARLPWQLVMSRDGRQIAVVRDEQIEIRSILDEFEIARAVWTVGTDPQPQWRRAVWNRLGTELAFATSRGSVSVWSHTGQCLHELAATTVSDELQEAVAGLAFMSTGKLNASLSHSNGEDMNGGEERRFLLVMKYGAVLSTYQLVRGDSRSVCLHHVSLLDYFPFGVGAMEYHTELDILIVAGWCDPQDNDSPLVTGWKLVSDPPYWTTLPGQTITPSRKNTVIAMMNCPRSHINKEWVFTMSVSPDGNRLATISLSGQLSLWNVPSFQLWRRYLPDNLPCTSSTAKGAVLPVEVSWWSDAALIIGNTSSEVMVPSLQSMVNLLGPSPEPGFSVTAAHHRQFLMLECHSELRVVGRTKLLPSFSDDSHEGDESLDFDDDDDDDDDDDEDNVKRKPSGTLIAKVSRLSATIFNPVLYFITEWDQFKPPRRKKRKLCHSYRLVCLKAMEPEECYERKMANQEYGEALELARRYGLDCDLVYQRQWHQSLPVTVAAIEDYLAHVSKLSWVLQECVHCVARDFLTMRDLLHYGRHISSFRKLKAAGVFAVEDVYQTLEAEIDGERDDTSSDDSEEEEDDISTEETVCTIQKLGRLSEEQMLILSCRQTILTYLDHLNTYEAILGGPVAADDRYDPKFFEQFRKQDLTRTAVQYAQDGNWQAVHTLFNLHGDVVLPHWLPILSCFPETLHPEKFSSLLPTLSDNGVMEDWKGEELRAMDWVEHPDIKKLYSIGRQLSLSGGDFLYDETPEWRQYNVLAVTGELLTQWYTERACEIEKFSGQVDNALALVQCGIGNGVQGLESLYSHLTTLHSLVYFCNVDTHFNLSRMQTMSELEILQLIMKDVEIDQYVSHFCEHAQPFLHRVMNKHSVDGSGLSLLEEYMVQVAKDDLRPCRDIIRFSRTKGAGIQLSIKERMSLCLKCVFACERSDQLDEADAIFECMPVSAGQHQGELSLLHKQLDELEEYLKAIDILRTYEVYKPVHFIRDIKDNADEVERLLVKITRAAAKKKPALTQQGWRSLQQHLITLQSTVFNCIDLSTCYQIFAESLLCSGNMDNILFAGQSLNTTSSTKSETSDTHHVVDKFAYILPFNNSVEVLIRAAQEYFNSASGPADECIELAKYCLSLVEEDHVEVNAELNLISSLGILHEFGINVLPVQVRLCENKLDLIRQVLDSSLSAYKKYNKIFKLSYLLGLSSELFSSIDDAAKCGILSEGLGHTIIVTALAAIQNNDFRLAMKLCNVLAHSQFADAWEVCSNLAVNDRYSGLDARIALLDFSLCHCPIEVLQHLLRERKALQMEAMYEECCQVQRYQSGWRGEERGIAAVQHLVGKSSLAVRDIVSRSAGAVQQFMWQRQTGTKGVAQDADKIVMECVMGLLEIASAQQLQESQGSPSVSVSLELKLVYHPFYTAAAKAPLLDRNKEKCCHVWLTLMRVYASFAVSNTSNSQFMSDALTNLARYHVDMDILLFVGYVLSLPSAEDAQEIFSLLPPTNMTYLMAEYIFSLHLYTSNCTEHHNEPHPYEHGPLSVIDHVLSHVVCSDESDWPDSQQAVVALLKHYQTLLDDHQQAHTLEQLGLGIDVQRFISDTVYKRDKILNLSRSESQSVLNTALLLARRHGVSEWEVCIEQLDELLTNSKLNAHDMQQKISERKIMKHLLLKPQKTADRLSANIYPNLPKTNYGVFFQFFTFLKWCEEKGASIALLSGQGQLSISIEAHLKLLKKLKSTIRGVDYRELVSGNEPLALLAPALTSSNVHSVAKLASLIPVQESEFLTADMVYKVFAEVMFWSGGSRGETPTSAAGWIHCLEACHEYIGKLGPQQFDQFVMCIVFSQKSLKLSMDTRHELLKRLEKFCNRKNSPEDPSTGMVAFAEMLKKIHCYQKHVDTMASLAVARPSVVEEVQWCQVVDQYYLSLSQPEQIEQLALSMCQNGLPLSLIATVLSLASTVNPQTITLLEAVKSTLMDLLNKLSDQPDMITGKPLASLVSSIAMYQREEGTNALVTSANVMDVTKVYCSDTTRSPNSKKTLLNILNEHLSLSPGDYSLLLLLQSQSILSNLFKIELAADAISSLENQQKCFMSLLYEASTTEQLDALVVLLQSWPKSSHLLPECWMKLMESLLSHRPLGADQVIMVRAGLKNMNKEVDEQLYSILKTAHKVQALQLAILSSHQSLASDSVALVKEGDSSLFNPTTMELVVLQGLVPVYLDTALYSYLCLYLRQAADVSVLNVQLLARLLACSESDLDNKLSLGYPCERVLKIAQQLLKAGKNLEAGSLLITSQEFMPALATIPSAITVVARTFK